MSQTGSTTHPQETPRECTPGTPERFQLADMGGARILCGPNNAHLQLIEKETGALITHRGDEVFFRGEEKAMAFARKVVEGLYGLVLQGRQLFLSDVEHAVRVLAQDQDADLGAIFLDAVYMSNRKRVITPQSIAQKRYVDAIRGHDIVFGIGPAGTGKTYLAMAMAIAALKKQQVQRIVLTRPAVEAGERLGFLPGDLAEKVNPYLRPLYDALHDMIDLEQATRMMERGILEVAPLAFMRGRTLNDSFIILDEAQNTTSEQMKMFLTRLGYDSRAVITGDITQVDLPSHTTSGLIEAKEILRGIKGISFCFFTDKDVVRHPLVQDVIRAYERHSRQKSGRSAENGNGQRNEQ